MSAPKTKRQSLSAIIVGLEARIAKLEATAHPPVDLIPRMDEHLRELGFIPTPIDHYFTPCNHNVGMCPRYSDPQNRCHRVGCGEARDLHLERP